MLRRIVLEGVISLSQLGGKTICYSQLDKRGCTF